MPAEREIQTFPFGWFQFKIQMNDFLFNTKLTLGSVIAWLTHHSIKIIIAVVIVALCVIGIQKACDARSVRIQNEKTARLDAERAEFEKSFDINLAKANSEHEIQKEILDQMAQITKNINILAENDKRISRRVDDIYKGDYTAARSQKRGQPTILERRRPNRNLQQRENDILELDKQLFP